MAVTIFEMSSNTGVNARRQSQNTQAENIWRTIKQIELFGGDVWQIEVWGPCTRNLLVPNERGFITVNYLLSERGRGGAGAELLTLQHNRSYKIYNVSRTRCLWRRLPVEGVEDRQNPA